MINTLTWENMSALGGTQTPNLQIRSKIPAVQISLWMSDQPVRGARGRWRSPATSRVIHSWCWQIR